MINQLIGNYRITAALAEGGMGTVYRGRHQNLPRDVVVKTIRLSSFHPRDQDQLKARFVREAYVQSQLDHPNTVRVYEFFTAEENYYLVMEFIDGMSLRELIQRRGALEPVHALPLLKQALSGLSYAHKFSYVDESGRSHTGVIHRDIKPANLLLDGLGRLKITDFGIVKVTGESGMTQTGFNPGTVEYMSPEQIRGLEVDARSDIYSVGVTFYEALSGQLPFPPSDTGSAYEVMRGHTELTPPSLAEVLPDLPAALAKLIMRALEKDPARRYQTADEWLNAITEYEHGAEKSQRTEVIAAAMTEVVNPPTEVLTEELAGRVGARGSQGVEPQVGMSQDVPETQLTPTPPPPKSTPSRAGLAALGIASLLIMAAIAGYFVWQRKGVPVETSSVPAQPVASPSAMPTAPPVVGESVQLRAAREAEETERYADAIRMYEDYLVANALAADATAIAKRLAEIKAFNGHLEIARVWMDQGDFREARKDYAAAVKARPSSKLAKSGLAAAEARLIGASAGIR